MTRTIQQRRSNLVIVVLYLHRVDEQSEEGGENSEMDVWKHSSLFRIRMGMK